MKKSIWMLVIVVVVAAVVYMNMEKQDGEVALVDEQDGAAEAAPEGIRSPDLLTGTYGLGGVDWVFTTVREGDGYAAPRTAARVQPLGVVRPDGRLLEVATWRLGEYDGSCAPISKPADEQVAAIAYAQCWWAGGGSQFRAVREGNVLRVDVRDVDEMESAPATFKQLVVIDLSTIAQ